MCTRAVGGLLFGVAAGCLQATPSSSSDCASCHGSDGNAAPPEALGGGTSTELVGVGAHRAHTDAGISCNECHHPVASVDAEGHMDDAWPAEVAWGDVAKAGGVATPWDHAALTCTTWCHGAGTMGGTLAAPTWTVVDGTQATCGTCHGVPPPSPHPSDTDCGTCHDGADGEHVDGIVQLAGDDTGDTDTPDCTGCHGDATSLAPPPDTSGLVATTERTVGAHRAHVDGGVQSAAVACADCHVVPSATEDAGHLDSAPAEVVFAGVAIQGGATPVWDTSALTCAGSYCHAGAGASNPSPAWTVVDGTQAACGACHGLPPPSPHPSGSACEGCHGSVAGSGLTIVDRAKHADGSVEF